MVAIMQADDSGHRYGPTTAALIHLYFTKSRRSLLQGQMRSVVVVVTDVFVYQAIQMPLIHNDHMVEQFRRQLPTQRFATPFCHGLRTLVRLGWMPKLFTVSIASSLKLAPRSKIR